MNFGKFYFNGFHPVKIRTKACSFLAFRPVCLRRKHNLCEQTLSMSSVEYNFAFKSAKLSPLALHPWIECCPTKLLSKAGNVILTFVDLNVTSLRLLHSYGSL
jgi:hypothetical protein